MNKYIAKRFRAYVTLCLVALFVLFFYGTPLPEKNAILDVVAHGAPLQEKLNEEKTLTKSYEDYLYTFTPHATYTISGLVVSLHHSDSWIDISHENDPAQTVDICVVWGPNISTGGYQMVTYDHGDWTCYYKWSTEHTPPFSGDYLANSHLIPASPALATIIKNIRVGDQIELSGTLVDYTISRSGTLVGKRKTSLIRTDTGNGACEILYLTDVKILKKNMPWREPVKYFLLLSVFGGSIGILYLGLRKQTITGTHHYPHTENPYDIKNFLANRKRDQTSTDKTHGHDDHRT